ncbi:retrotransposon protein, putative, ty1-copia subclass [Tanacetum coccineum]
MPIIRSQELAIGLIFDHTDCQRGNPAILDTIRICDFSHITNSKAILLDPEFDKWLGAMNAEMQSMKDNQVWCLVDLPSNETFSPVADIRAIRILIAITVFYDCGIWQMDVKNVFLNGYLDEDIYMVLKRLIGLSQSAYMDKILKRFRTDTSKPGYIPMQERLDLNKTQGPSTPEEVKRMQNVPYASAVGSIMYAIRCTRPDVAFTQNITSRFQQNPGEPHWSAMKTILKYLRNTKDVFLVYGGNLEAEL